MTEKSPLVLKNIVNHLFAVKLKQLLHNEYKNIISLTEVMPQCMFSTLSWNILDGLHLCSVI